jgi:hypothetical protein
VDAAGPRGFLLDLASRLRRRTYGESIVYSPMRGAGKPVNEGFDAFVPLIDPGISAYVWTGSAFASILIFSRVRFDERLAIAFVSERLGMEASTTPSF